jgi:hypothetical protein
MAGGDAVGDIASLFSKPIKAIVGLVSVALSREIATAMALAK